MDLATTAPAIGILADDLTGATDTGLQFATRGIRTIVTFGTWPLDADADVVVVNTNTRNLPQTVAYDRVLEVALQMRISEVGQVYKKVDSTARGNLGAEIDAVLDAGLASGALVCTAFPGTHRTVRDGQVFVRDTILTSTEFARDPLHPATDARLYAILQRQTRRGVSVLPLKLIRAGPAVVADEISRQRAAGVEVVVADAVTDTDLACLGKAIGATVLRWLPAGSAGLAAQIDLPARLRSPRPVHPADLGLPTSALPHGRTKSRAPVVVVVGSLNPIAAEQAACIEDVLGIEPVRLALHRWLEDRAAHVAEVTERLRDQLRTERAVSLVASAEGHDLFKDLRLPTRLALGARLCTDLAAAVRSASESLNVGGFVVTGGDTGQALCLELDVESLEVTQQVAPGVPLSRIRGGERDGTPIVTKAGGFGERTILWQAVELIWRWNS